MMMMMMIIIIITIIIIINSNNSNLTLVVAAVIGIRVDENSTRGRHGTNNLKNTKNHALILKR